MREYLVAGGIKNSAGPAAAIELRTFANT